MNVPACAENYCAALSLCLKTQGMVGFRCDVSCVFQINSKHSVSNTTNSSDVCNKRCTSGSCCACFIKKANWQAASLNCQFYCCQQISPGFGHNRRGEKFLAAPGSLKSRAVIRAPHLRSCGSTERNHLTDSLSTSLGKEWISAYDRTRQI